MGFLQDTVYAKLGYVSATDEDINDKTKLKFKIVDKSKYSIILNTEHFHFTTWWFDDIKYVCAIFFNLMLNPKCWNSKWMVIMVLFILVNKIILM